MRSYKVDQLPLDLSAVDRIKVSVIEQRSQDKPQVCSNVDIKNIYIYGRSAQCQSFTKVQSFASYHQVASHYIHSTEIRKTEFGARTNV